MSGTTTGLPSNFGHPSAEVIFQISISSFTAIKVSTCNSTFDTFARFYDSQFQEVCSSDDSSVCSPQTDLFCSVAPGEYSVLVEGSGFAEGDYVVSVECPGVYSL